MSIKKIIEEKYGQTSDIGQDAGTQGAAIMVYLEFEHEAFKKIKKGVLNAADNMEILVRHKMAGEDISMAERQSAAADLIFLHKTILGAFLAQVGLRYAYNKCNNLDDLWKSYVELSKALKRDPGSRDQIEEDVEQILEEFRDELEKKAQS